MPPTFQLRAYCYLDRIQPQYAAWVGAVTQGDLPVPGMASLYVEMAPGSWIYRLMDAALKGSQVRPGAQVVEREFGMLEVHAFSQADVQQAGAIILEMLGKRVEDRIKPRIASIQVITRVEPYQAQLVNRTVKGMMLVPGQTLFVMEVTPAVYVNLAANEAEKAAQVNLLHLNRIGRYGRLWMAGSEASIQAARDAAVAAIEDISGVEA
jgi:hypothetical protein